MAKTGNIFTYIRGAHKKRPGVHAKAQTSHLKSSKNYKKKYRGQGR